MYEEWLRQKTTKYYFINRDGWMRRHHCDNSFIYFTGESGTGHIINEDKAYIPIHITKTYLTYNECINIVNELNRNL